MTDTNKTRLSMEKAVELLFLQDKIRDMTKEYFLFVGETKSRKVPLTAYPRLQKAIFRSRSALNKNLKTENLKIRSNGVFLGKDYDVRKECRAYLHHKLVRILAPAIKLEGFADILLDRYMSESAYTEEELAGLERLTLRLEKIFAAEKIPKNPELLPFPKDFRVYISFLREYHRAFKAILSGVWHGTLKTGERLNAFFPDTINPETLSAFRALPFPALFEIKGEDIILCEISENIFLFLLSGLLAKEFVNKHYGWVFYTRAYFCLCADVTCEENGFEKISFL